MHTLPSAERDPFGAPHLRTTSEVFRLDEFLRSADHESRARWCSYVADTVRSLRNVEGREPSGEVIRKSVAIGLGMSETFRRLVVANGGAEEARTEASYLDILQAGAGAIIEQCLDRAENGRRRDSVAR
jgi:hypothetical protein